MTTPEPHPPEWHRPVLVDRIGPGGLELDIVADTAERAALAERLGVPAVAALSCHFRLARGLSGIVFAEALLRARLTRVCVITLEEFEAEVEEPFRLRFVPAGSESEEVDPESDDEIPYSSGTIDPGEAAAEQLALSLDPYPRKPGAELPEDAVAPPDSAFAALSRRTPRN